MVYEQNGNIGNEMENLKKSNLEMKIITKRIIHQRDSKPDLRRYNKDSELEDRTVGIIKYEKPKET